jgi:hypothetical protein
MNAQLEIEPSAELRQPLERPRPRLSDAEVDAWAAALVETWSLDCSERALAAE